MFENNMKTTASKSFCWNLSVLVTSNARDFEKTQNPVLGGDGRSEFSSIWARSNSSDIRQKVDKNLDFSRERKRDMKGKAKIQKKKDRREMLVRFGGAEIWSV